MYYKLAAVLLIDMPPLSNNIEFAFDAFSICIILKVHN